MEGFQIIIRKITPIPGQEADKYPQERSEEIYDQRVQALDIRKVIAVVNGLPFAS